MKSASLFVNFFANSLLKVNTVSQLLQVSNYFSSIGYYHIQCGFFGSTHFVSLLQLYGVLQKCGRRSGAWCVKTGRFSSYKNFRHSQLSAFRYRLIKSGFVGTTSFWGFREMDHWSCQLVIKPTQIFNFVYHSPGLKGGGITRKNVQIVKTM